MSCLPRRFTPGESDPGSLAGSWIPGRDTWCQAEWMTKWWTRGFCKSSEAFSEELLRSLWEIPYKYIIGRMGEKKELGEREQERKETQQVRAGL